MTNRLAHAVKLWWHDKTDPEKRQFRKRVRTYFRERGQGTPNTYSGLGPGSVVFDLGGYKGEWADAMRRLYDCHVHVFEPHPTFAAILQQRFAEDAKVTCHDFALGRADGSLSLSDSADASSAFIKDGAHVVGRIRAAAEVLAELDPSDIAVTKINIEGGEYDILPALIDTGWISKFQTLTIQFHNYSEGDKQRRADIRAGLAKTHRCTWNYEFVWEEWVRLDVATAV